jgi:hypothetical protein
VGNHCDTAARREAKETRQGFLKNGMSHRIDSIHWLGADGNRKKGNFQKSLVLCEKIK